MALNDVLNFNLRLQSILSSYVSEYHPVHMSVILFFPPSLKGKFLSLYYPAPKLLKPCEPAVLLEN